MTAFVRLIGAESSEKGEGLASAIHDWRHGRDSECLFEVDPLSFRQVPGSPFAYWVEERFRRAFVENPALGSGRISVLSTNPLNDDVRFGRVWWEVPADRLGKSWVPWAKGGPHRPFYHDVETVIRWSHQRNTFGGFLGTKNRPTPRPANVEYFFRPGLTWPRRSQLGLSVRALPKGCVFGDKGPAIQEQEDRKQILLALLGLTNSAPFRSLVGLQMAFGSFEVGVVQRTPIPAVGGEDLADTALAAWKCHARLDSRTQTSHGFTVPALLQVPGRTIDQRAETWARYVGEVEAELGRLKAKIDQVAVDSYGFAGAYRQSLDENAADNPDAAEGGDGSTFEEEDEVEGYDVLALTEALMEWALGSALGRFDMRLATEYCAPTPDRGPFDPLPVFSPGMLHGGDGLPAAEAPTGYPLSLPADGILVDDPGHPWDVVARMEAVLERVAEGRAHEWLQEAEGIFGRDLRDWLRRYGFERHLKRYSRSRRKAPLFWHLAPKSREYGIWLYSPAATRDTFYRVQNDYVEPKLKAAERRLLELRQIAGATPTGQQRKDLASQESLVEELRAFREQVALVAPLWTPFRDDGVVLNCAVLSNLFDHHRAWQKECAKKWGDLADGKYEWAGWAMHLWPARAVAECASDRSIAIAHGLEEALWEEGKDGKWKPRADAEEQVAKLVAERRSPAVQAALDAFERAG